MIELIIKYITDKGYKVDIKPASEEIVGALWIYKVVDGLMCGYMWYISKYDLQPQLEQALYWQADSHIAEIERVIAQQKEGTHAR
jgi:hypothetical protein